MLNADKEFLAQKVHHIVIFIMLGKSTLMCIIQHEPETPFKVYQVKAPERT